ncbi:hypothetical protein PR048_010551 [Dryococelus australis]|uniref:PiggyBac transposable element-derived protein domain-containing protein n=1 Tax=Dryococelus australis TaxID=614101 RepID=A0ABQ9I339_9NEOP|nr:hypothetical protein PR048_010551 [Dryococelus australis]
MLGRGKREIPEETRRPAAWPSTIPTYENPRATQPGTEPGSPWWESLPSGSEDDLSANDDALWVPDTEVSRKSRKVDVIQDNENSRDNETVSESDSECITIPPRSEAVEVTTPLSNSLAAHLCQSPQHGMRLPLGADNMSYSRFSTIRKYIHFVDNFQKHPDFNATARHAFGDAIELDEFLSVDEMMIPFKGTSSLKQYLRNKPHPWGDKLWVLATASGYVLNFDIYQGNPGRKEPCGNHSVCTSQQSNISIRCWYDSSAVHVASTFAGVVPLGNTRRWNMKEKEYESIPQHYSIGVYNKPVGFTCRHLLPHRKGQTLVAVVNCWLLWRMNNEEKMDLLEFKSSVTTSLIYTGEGKQSKRGRPSSTEMELPVRKKREYTTTSEKLCKDGG